MESPVDFIVQLIPLLVTSLALGVVAYKLAVEKGRNVPLWTVLGFLPLINFPAMAYFIGAANLHTERKLDELLSRK